MELIPSALNGADPKATQCCIIRAIASTGLTFKMQCGNAILKMVVTKIMKATG
nr:MAG TPA: hypothetical protein [Caudoviricetes sp.]